MSTDVTRNGDANPADGAATPPAIEVSHLTKAFGGVHAVSDVSLTVPQGSFFGIIGPNGSGKSTLLDCISGIHTTYEGRVFFEGADITRKPIHKISRAGMLRTFQVSRLFEDMSVLSNVMVAAPDQDGETLGRATLGRWSRSQLAAVRRARELLDHYELERVEQSYASELSGGQRRLLELARLLIMQPRAVLLDEPFAGVSPVNRSRLANQLQAFTEAGITVLMVEHRLELVERLCDRVAVMAEGRLIAQGAMAALRQDHVVIDAYLGDFHHDALRM